MLTNHHKQQRAALVRLGVAKKRSNAKLLHTYVGWKADKELTEIKVGYAAILGRPVSHSLIIRRALELLREHLRGVKAAEAVAEEVQSIERNVR